jgi:Flp pilus assembly protein TadG
MKPCAHICELRRMGQKGTAILEMAFFVAGFPLLIMALLDLGSVLDASLELGNALRAGMQVATRQPANSDAVVYTVQNTGTLPPADVLATATAFCECGGVEVACTSTCDSGPMAAFVTITAGYNVPLVFTYPVLPNPYPLRKTLTVRVQ